MLAQPVLGVQVMRDGVERFAPRHRLDCNDGMTECTLRLDREIVLTMDRNLSQIAGNCMALEADGVQYPCQIYWQGATSSGFPSRMLVQLRNVPLTDVQMARMQVEGWIVQVVSGRGMPLMVLLIVVSSWVGVNFGRNFHHLQLGWGTPTSRAYAGSLLIGAFVATTAWMPFWIVIKVFHTFS